jgi:hypothetical protein
MMGEMQRLANAGDIARNQAQVAENERVFREQRAQQAIMQEQARRNAIAYQKEEKRRYEREMRLRESESFGRRWANQTMARGFANAMNSAATAVGGDGGGGGVQTAVFGAGGQRIGGGSISPIGRSLLS